MDEAGVEKSPPFSSWRLDLTWSQSTDSGGGLGASRGDGSETGPIFSAMPGWVAVHSAEGASTGLPETFPEPGEVVAGFRIVSELGQGAFARVFLAEQVDLSCRRVVLKISRALGDEPRMLARLQHTHIVPIHSVHDDPASGLRLLCMPYLGGANLAQLLEALDSTAGSEATGQSLVEALDRVGHRVGRVDPRGRRAGPATDPGGTAASAGPGSMISSWRINPSAARSIWRRCRARISGREGVDEAAGVLPDVGDPSQPARNYLRGASFIQASTWIGALLAEALDHAHSRGLLHRDLKPSNILIAADGTPMLLDFNLSADVHGVDGGDRARLGGTLPYMAPEHLDAFHPSGTTPAGAVDARSDLYGLGLILFEMIAGHHPFADVPEGLELDEALDRMIAERGRAAPSLRAANPQVSWGLDAIVRRCLEPDPARRYPRARDLAEDLRRLTDDRPLKFVREPSLSERARKWARRNPRACSSTSMAAVAAALILGLGSVIGLVSDRGEAAWALVRRGWFRQEFASCQLLLNTTSGPAEHLDSGIEAAERALGYYGVGDRDDWTQGPAVRRLDPADRGALLEEVSELVLLLARAWIYQAEAEGDDALREAVLLKAIDWLDRAERFDPHPSAALFSDRARYRAALGLADEAARDRDRQAATTPRSAGDFYLLGTSALAWRQQGQAEAYLNRALALDPTRFWAWFAMGLCHADQGRLIEAAGDFGTCTALAPKFPWPHLNRGLALARAGRPLEARAAYDRALSLNPRFAEALVDRGLIALELGDPERAALDLDRALALGRRDPSVRAARAEASARLGQRTEARRDFDRLVIDHPDDPIVRIARGMFLLAEPDGRPTAQADFALALEVAPGAARARLGLALLARPDDPRVALGQLALALEAEPNLFAARGLRALIRARLGDPAALADVEVLGRSMSPRDLYNAACALAILARDRPDSDLASRAIDLLGRAIEAGVPAGPIEDDPDLEPLRELPAFRALSSRARIR